MSSFSAHAVCALLAKPELAEAFSANLIGSLGLSVYTTSVEEELEASILTKNLGLDFDDGLQYFVTKKLGAEAIVSFDRTDLRRLNPEKRWSEFRSRPLDNT